MLRRYKVISGEFSLVVKEKNCESAVNEALRLHKESRHHSSLGQITMVESRQEEVKFFFTQNVLDDLFNQPTNLKAALLRR